MRSLRSTIAGAAILLAAAVAPNAVRPQLATGSSPSGIDLDTHPIGGFGIDLSARDPAVKPGDDFFMSQNGAWYARAVIPATMTAAGYWFELRIKSVWREQAILEAAAATRTASRGSIEAKVGAFYRAYMDSARVDALGVTPLLPAIDAIHRAGTRRDVAALMGRIAGPGTVRAVNTLGPSAGRGVYSIDIAQDADHPTRNAVYLGTAGTMLRAPSFYLDAKLATVRQGYERHVAKVLALIGWPEPDARAADIVALETRIAAAEVATGNAVADAKPDRLTLAELTRIAPGFDWHAFLSGAELPNVESVLVDSRDAAVGIAAVLSDAPMPVLQARLAYATAASRALALDGAMRAADFELRTLVRNGAAPSPRDRTAALTIEANMGDALGALYVRRYFTPTAKAQAEAMVANLRAAMSARLERVPWLSAATRTKAQAKLSATRVKIGYPETVDDYRGLAISDTDLYGDIVRGAEYNWHRLTRQLDRSVDRDAWPQTFPQTVNSFAINELNDAGFPAGLLQPPFLDPNADAAVNYGGLGAFMGAAIVDRFNIGRHYLADGRRADWWTPDELATFTGEAKKLSAQYAAFEPLPGFHVNGDQTLNGSLDDLGGLLLALDAYHRSLAGKPAPVIDGFTGDQRFFMAWAQFWRLKFRPEFIRNQLATDPNSPAIVRANATVRNVDAWYEAFNVQPGDKLYIAPEHRVRIW
jgi:putative endopeptidase